MRRTEHYTEAYGRHRRNLVSRPQSSFDGSQGTHGVPIPLPSTVTASSFMNAWWYRHLHTSADVAEVGRAVLLARTRAEGRSIDDAQVRKFLPLTRSEECTSKQEVSGASFFTANGSRPWVKRYVWKRTGRLT